MTKWNLLRSGFLALMFGLCANRASGEFPDDRVISEIIAANACTQGMDKVELHVARKLAICIASGNPDCDDVAAKRIERALRARCDRPLALARFGSATMEDALRTVLADARSRAERYLIPAIGGRSSSTIAIAEAARLDRFVASHLAACQNAHVGIALSLPGRAAGCDFDAATQRVVSHVESRYGSSPPEWVRAIVTESPSSSSAFGSAAVFRAGSASNCIHLWDLRYRELSNRLLREQRYFEALANGVDIAIVIADWANFYMDTAVLVADIYSTTNGAILTGQLIGFAYSSIGVADDDGLADFLGSMTGLAATCVIGGVANPACLLSATVTAIDLGRDFYGHMQQGQLQRSIHAKILLREALSTLSVARWRTDFGYAGLVDLIATSHDWSYRISPSDFFSFADLPPRDDLVLGLSNATSLIVVHCAGETAATPTPTPTTTPTPTHTRTPTRAPTPSITATPPPTVAPTATRSNTPVLPPTPISTNTATRTLTVMFTPTPTRTNTLANLPTQTPTQPPAEICDGLDNDNNGTFDGYESGNDCWIMVYRWRHPLYYNHCLSTSSSSAPSPCSGYVYDRVAFIVPRYSVPGTFAAVQCSKAGSDHILVEQGSAAHSSLLSAGYSCSVTLGFPFRVGSQPNIPSPWGLGCPIYRATRNTAIGGEHIFTIGADNLGGYTPEPPARGYAFDDNSFSCFSSPPAGF